MRTNKIKIRRIDIDLKYIKKKNLVISRALPFKDTYQLELNIPKPCSTDTE